MVTGLALTFTLGLLVNIWGVPQLIRLGENLIGHIPLVKTIYGAVRDLFGFFAKSGGLGAGNKVVMVSLAETGIRMVGLPTREQFDDLPPGLGGEGYVVVYVPYRSPPTNAANWRSGSHRTLDSTAMTTPLLRVAGWA